MSDTDKGVQLNHPLRLVPTEAPAELDEHGDPVGQEQTDPETEVKPIAEPEEQLEDDPMRPGAIPLKDWHSFQGEMTEKGELTEESYARLAELGFSKSLVDDYVSSRLVAVTAQETSLYADFGGREKWDNDIASWARDNLTAEQRDTFNTKISSGSIQEIKVAMSEVVRLQQEALGKEASTNVEGRRPSDATTVKPFVSANDYQRAIGDPRWLKDSEYTQNVRARWALSKKRGMTIND